MLSYIVDKIYHLVPNKQRGFWDKLRKSNIGNRLVGGAFWSLLGAVSSKGLMLISSMIIARFLGQEEYGQLGIIKTTINTFAIFAGFGIGITATKYVAELRYSDKERAGKVIGLSTIFSVTVGALIASVLYVFSDVIALTTINSPDLSDELKLGAFMLFFSAINGSQVGILSGFEAFRSLAKVNFISSVISYPIQTVLAYLYGLKGAVVGFGIFFVLFWALNNFAVRRVAKENNIIIDYFNGMREWPILYKFSLPALLSGLMVSPVTWFCYAMLVKQPNGFKEMAVFDVANQWRGLVLFAPAALGQIVLPLLSSLAGSENNKKYIKILNLNIMLSVVTVTLLIMPIVMFPNFILGLYGNSFVGNESVIIILVTTALFSAVCNVVGQAIASSGKMWHGFLFNLIWAFLLIVFTIIFINEGLGALALAYAFFISYFIHLCNQGIYIYIIYNRRTV